MSQPALTFLPWVRRGGSLALPADNPATHPPSHVGTTVAVSVNDVPGTPVPVQLLGPGDVTGVASQQVIRMDPSPGTTKFESNYLALVEFDDPALPWLFTTASAVAGKLRPWLTLVVVREQPGVQLAPAGRGSLPVLRIGGPAKPEAELPDLADSWAWAHAQVALDGGSGAAALVAALGGDPARNLSRLVSGRLLAEQTGYLACVVPTFEAGRRAGLGDDPGQAEGPAWTLSDGMAAVELPVYHHWRFATGPNGDFQSLAMAIRGRKVEPGFGVRAVDLSTAGLGLPGTDDAQVFLSGALLALDSPVRHWSDPALATVFADALRGVLNAPDVAPRSEPLLAPPRYGSAYRTPVALDPAATGRWYEQVNTDPAARIAAALGTLVVQQQQETLVGAAWDQSVDLRPATRLLGLAGLGLAMAASLHRRHIAPLAPQSGLFVLAPLRGRLMVAPAMAGVDSFSTQWTKAQLPVAALGSAVRRVTRARGPAVRGEERGRPRSGGQSTPGIDWIGRMVPSSRIERSFEAPMRAADLRRGRAHPADPAAGVVGRPAGGPSHRGASQAGFHAGSDAGSDRPTPVPTARRRQPWPDRRSAGRGDRARPTGPARPPASAAPPGAAADPHPDRPTGHGPDARWLPAPTR